VAAYRLWRRAPGGDWVRVGDGQTADDEPDFHRVGRLASGAEIAWWIGIGGNPATHFRIVLTFGQGGRLLEGGTCLEEGRTDEAGLAQREGVVKVL
jgi:hypothetical protein